MNNTNELLLMMSTLLNITKAIYNTLNSTTDNSTGIHYSNERDILLNATTNSNSSVETESTIANAVLLAIETHFWLIFSPLIFFFGLFGNILNVVILIRLKFFKNATLCLLFILAFTDMTVLIVGLPRYFLKYAINFDLRTVSQFSCKFSLFLIYFSMQLSSWILVLVTIIRYIKTVYPLGLNKIRGHISVKKSLIYFAVVAVLLAGIDFHFFWTNGITADNDCSSLTPEYKNFDEYNFVYIDFVFLSLLPALIMIILNGFILRVIQQLKVRSRRSSALNKNTKEPVSKVTKMLIVTSSYFIIATVPISVYFIVDSYLRPNGDSATAAKLDVAWTISYLLEFSHFALNFYFYTATNERFRKELKRIIRHTKHRVMAKVHPDSTYEAAHTRERKYSRSLTASS